MEEMKSIRFTSQALGYRDGYTPETFLEGETHELPGWFADQFISMGVAVPSDQEPSTPTAPATGGNQNPEPTDPFAAEELEKLSRAQLNELALAVGVDGAKDLPNKGAVIEAILAAPQEKRDAYLAALNGNQA